MACEDKKTERLTVWLPMRVELELRRLAEHDARTLGEYVGMVLTRHVYGHAPKNSDYCAADQRGE